MVTSEARFPRLDLPRPRRATIRSIRAEPARHAQGTIANDPEIGSPVAIRVPGRGVVITTPIVRMLGVAGAPERFIVTRRGNVYALWIEPGA